MKKILIGSVIGLVVLAVAAVVAIHFFLDAGVKRGVETVGPMLTKVSVKVDGVSVSPLSGSGKVKGLVVGNPEGFKTPSAIKVGTASMALVPGSLLQDKIIVRSINLQGPEITYETDLKSSNLNKILENVETAAGLTDTNAPAAEEATVKLQVDEFVITGGKVNVSVTTLGGKSLAVPLPEIRLTNLGQGPDGITAADLTKVVLRELQKVTAQTASGAVADLSKAAVGLTQDAGKTASEAAGQVTRSLGDIFKKKQ